MVYKTNSKQRKIMELTLPQAIDYYLTALTLEGKSSETILWHRKKLAAFATFLQNGGAPLKICSLAVEDGRAFVKLLMERTTKYDDHLHREQVQGGLAPQTIHGFVRSLRAFASWLERKGYTQDNIFKAIKPPSSPKF